jgi:hypothetical protein
MKRQNLFTDARDGENDDAGHFGSSRSAPGASPASSPTPSTAMPGWRHAIPIE